MNEMSTNKFDGMRKLNANAVSLNQYDKYTGWGDIRSVKETGNESNRERALFEGTVRSGASNTCTLTMYFLMR